ncbi:DUF4405 domain-containing protein [Clostridium arbusti]|uniref:DUF4405 domain-containing protein n=1 Tax=Clostridium arbusti TaxID=1137848 RepID=UPI000287D32B|nr:DUF4405 domain-containing protein [Clostridium arbusti]
MAKGFGSVKVNWKVGLRVKKETIVKLYVDVAMTVFFFIMLSYQLTEDIIHEIMGMLVFILFIVHNFLNRNWYKALVKGRYTVVRIIRTVVNMLLLAAVLGIVISAFSISQIVIPFSKWIDIPYAREIHMFCAYWAFILIAVHIGLHWSIMIGMVCKKNKEKEPGLWKNWSAKIVAAFIALYGIYAFVKREIGSYLLLYNSYAFWNFEEWAGWFFIDLFAMMGLCIFFTYYIIKWIQKLKYN